MTMHTKSVMVKVKPHHMATTQMKFKCWMHQLPVNLNDATTGYKLQGMSKATTGHKLQVQKHNNNILVAY